MVHLLSVLISTPVYLRPSIRSSSLSVLMSSPSPSPNMEQKKSCFEVEQKFATPDLEKIQCKLTELGFSSSKEPLTFMDWYFDVEPLTLCTQDCWLRFRQISQHPDGGEWQLKRGRKVEIGEESSKSSTVYEELEGDAAIDAVESLLSEASIPDNKKQADSQMDGFQVPKIPRIGNYGMEPFARIQTFRSSWKVKESEIYDGISVDLDGTDYGYTVGEVEVVVSSDADIPRAKEKVQSVITNIVGRKSPTPTLGKLEVYLKDYRRDVFEACVEFGSMTER